MTQKKRFYQSQKKEPQHFILVTGTGKQRTENEPQSKKSGKQRMNREVKSAGNSRKTGRKNDTGYGLERIQT